MLVQVPAPPDQLARRVGVPDRDRPLERFGEMGLRPFLAESYGCDVDAASIESLRQHGALRLIDEGKGGVACTCKSKLSWRVTEPLRWLNRRAGTPTARLRAPRAR